MRRIRRYIKSLCHSQDQGHPKESGRYQARWPKGFWPTSIGADQQLLTDEVHARILAPTSMIQSAAAAVDDALRFCCGAIAATIVQVTMDQAVQNTVAQGGDDQGEFVS